MILKCKDTTGVTSFFQVGSHSLCQANPGNSTAGYSVSCRRDHLADGAAKAGGGTKLPVLQLPAPSLAGHSVYLALAGPSACSFPLIAPALCVCELQSTAVALQLIC